MAKDNILKQTITSNEVRDKEMEDFINEMKEEEKK